VTVTYGGWNRAKAAAATHTLLDEDPGVTAVFACADSMALGVYDALASRGLRVAEDISVVGFDDVPEAQWATPQLTTIRQPSAEMGSAAVKLLLESRLRGGEADLPHPRVEMLTSLVVRASTAAT
jgi:LacI family transcriptional regulator